MSAELIMIGTELLLGDIVDTNAAFLARGLAACGIDLYYKSTVGDNLERASEILSQALKRSDLILISGGLGPTADDITREIVAAVTGRPLEKDEEIEAELEEWQRQRFSIYRQLSAGNRKQAAFPQGAQPIPNPRGTAAGFFLDTGSATIIALPGVPQELKAMFEESVQPYLMNRYKGAVLVTRNLNFAGIGEADLEQELADLLGRQNNPTLALYASMGQVRLRLTAKAPSVEEGKLLISPLEEAVVERCSEFLYGFDNQTLEEALGEQLRQGGSTIALAESCTGGLIGHRLTNVAGSSAYFLRSYVVYSNQAKQDDLGVSQEILAEFGAVSPETAQAMAEGVRRKSEADYGLAVTGIAGPGGGNEEKPVGLVYISLAFEGQTIVERHFWRGSREQIKYRASQAALYCLWRVSRPG